VPIYAQKCDFGTILDPRASKSTRSLLTPLWFPFESLTLPFGDSAPFLATFSHTQRLDVVLKQKIFENHLTSSMESHQNPTMFITFSASLPVLMFSTFDGIWSPYF